MQERRDRGPCRRNDLGPPHLSWAYLQSLGNRGVADDEVTAWDRMDGVLPDHRLDLDGEIGETGEGG